MTDCMASYLLTHQGKSKESPLLRDKSHYFLIIDLLGAEAHLIALCAIISRVFREESSCNYLYEV